MEDQDAATRFSGCKYKGENGSGKTIKKADFE